MRNIKTKVVEALGTGRLAYGVLRIAANIVDAEVVVIGGETYEFDTAANPGEITAGNIRVYCSAATPTVASTALVAAINANTKLGIVATRLSANEVHINTIPGKPPVNYATTTTMTGVGNGWGAATMLGAKENFVAMSMQTRVATAEEVALTALRFKFPFTPVSAIIQVTDTNGVPRAWNGGVIISGTQVSASVGTGDGTAIVATDKVTVFASA